MSTAYAECLRVEASSMLELASWLEMQAEGGRFVLVGTHNSPLEDELQLAYGDAFAAMGGRLQSFEFKAEQRASANFFLETWSNRKANRRGWLFTSRADWLCYYFRTPAAPTLYVMPMKALGDWALMNAGKYRHVEQRRYEQRNDTWGLVVPIRDVREAVGAAVWRPSGATWERDE